MCFHASLGVAQLKPAVYHSSLPCVTSKLHHAWFGLFMTQSQEGHVCLRWALCNRTWTRIKKIYCSPSHTIAVLLSRISCQKVSQQVLGPTGLWGNLSGPGKQRYSLSVPCVLHSTTTEKTPFQSYLAIENLSLLAVFCLFFCSAWKLWDCRDLGRDDKNKREDKGNRVYKIWRTKSRAKKICILT